MSRSTTTAERMRVPSSGAGWLSSQVVAKRGLAAGVETEGWVWALG
jgi:hypothetical protein